MDALTLQLRGGDDQAIECWDDDGDLHCTDDIHFRTVSAATSVTNSSVRRSGHRDSISSRRSARSDVDSTAGNDEDWQVLLNDNDDIVNPEAIASAKNAGIPIPANVPKSALLGGTIKRLGRRKTKKEMIDDWSEDVALPGPESLLELKSQPAGVFPESLADLDFAAHDPAHYDKVDPRWDACDNPARATRTSLEAFREHDSDLDLDDVPTIRVAKSRLVGDPDDVVKSSAQAEAKEDFEKDFDLPTEGLHLQLSARGDAATGPRPTHDDLDVDWLEGSIGVRFGGTARDRRSNPGSSISAVSPTASSCLTMESEEDRLDGLVIPAGPLDLKKTLRQRQSPGVTERPVESKISSGEMLEPEDFFTGLEVGKDDTFMPGRLSVNPNIRRKTQRPGSPSRRSATSITFTHTNISPKTRIPRLSGHDRPHSTHLETVCESGAPLMKFRRPQHRLSGHSSNMSTSSCPASGVPLTPPTPTRRIIAHPASKETSLNEASTSRMRHLQSKRSMPMIGNSLGSTSMQTRRSPTRLDATYRPPSSSSRPRTPNDGTSNDSIPPVRKTQRPLTSAGSLESSTQHTNLTTYRHSRRANSDTSNDVFSSGHIPRLSRFSRSEPVGRTVHDARSGKRTLTKPTRRRNFGDGSELELFDDLPTSASAESKFVKYPTGHGVPRSFRSRFGQNQGPTRTETPTQPSTPNTASRPPETPRFARDTAASRNAREQRIASLSTSAKLRDSNAPTSQGAISKLQAHARTPSGGAPTVNKKIRSGTSSKARPQLIKPLGTGVQEAKSIKGMHYNPATCRWEGNENSVSGFDLVSPKSPKPAPALITNVSAMHNVQVVGGMVFDPKRMCWLKLAPTQPGLDGVVAVQDEDDVFAGLDDLTEKPPRAAGAADGSRTAAAQELGASASGDERSGDSSDDWPITEEFDVGPEFIKRQRAEEEKWRRKVDKWTCFDRAKLGDGWRWAIRELSNLQDESGATTVPDSGP